MIFLAFVWLVLMVVEFASKLPEWARISGLVIWGLFVLEFSVKVALAPNKFRYVFKHWLTAIALFVPALRVLRPLRILRLTAGLRGAQVLRVVASLNRSRSALQSTLGRRGVAFVAVLTLIVCLGGAAGMYAFERQAPANGFANFPDALWWTAMTLTTSGSGYWPVTNEGRILGFLLSLYAFSVFGYLAGTLASFFVERDAAAPDAETLGKRDYEAMMSEIRSLKTIVEARIGRPDH